MTARRTMTRRSLALAGLGGVMAAGAGVVTGVVPGRAELKSQYHDWFSPHSPDVAYSGRASANDAALAGSPLGVWCGRSDPLYDDVHAFVSALPQRPQIVSYGPGAHTRAYWDNVTLPAFAFVGAAL